MRRHLAGCYLLWTLSLPLCYFGNAGVPVTLMTVMDYYPIRVALAVDDHSLKDLILLMNSVVESTVIHTLASYPLCISDFK